MGLLQDEDLIKNLIDEEKQYVKYVQLPKDDADRYSKRSPVQASSIDLHIGDIYLPGMKTSACGVTQTKPDHTLKTGETAVVTTQEKVQLPNDVAAFGFPPSSVSFKGLMMTNPGHVDPGYKGHLRFTVINMAKDSFSLRKGDRIVRLLFFKLDKPAKADWKQRNSPNTDNPNPSQSEVNQLSKDFIDVDRRAKSIAKRQGVQWSVGITGGVALLAAILQMISTGHLFGGNKDLEDLQKKYDALEKRVDLPQKLAEYDKKLSDLENKVQSLQKGQTAR